MFQKTGYHLFLNLQGLQKGWRNPLLHTPPPPQKKDYICFICKLKPFKTFSLADWPPHARPPLPCITLLHLVTSVYIHQTCFQSAIAQKSVNNEAHVCVCPLSIPLYAPPFFYFNVKMSSNIYVHLENYFQEYGTLPNYPVIQRYKWTESMFS